MKRFMLVPIFFALIGCAPSPLTIPMIIINPNESGGATTYSLAYNYVRPSDDIFRKTILKIHLDIQRLDLKGYRTRFQLVLVYSGTKWLHIEEGKSLILFLDGQRFVLNSVKPENAETKGSIVTEGAAYPVTPEELVRIAKATQVRLIIIGKEGRREATFTPTNTEFFRRFVNLYVTPTADSAIPKPNSAGK